MVLFLFRSRIDVDLWLTDTSALLRSRFEADFWFTDLFALLDPQSKASQTWFCSGLNTRKPVKLGSVLVLLLKASQTWFCFGLTLGNRSNLVLFRSYTWKPIKLVISTLSYVCLPGLTLHCQPCCASDFVTLVCLIGLTTLMPILFFPSGLTSGCQFLSSFYLPGLTSECQSKRLQIQLSWDFWKLRSCLNMTFFLPEGLSEAFIGCTGLLTLHPCFRENNTYLMQCFMQCMIMNGMSEYLNLSFLIWICFIPLF